MIAHLEAIARSAWPAQSETRHDGWLLCLGGGYTRRTNSVHPVEGGVLPLAGKIEHAEAFYRAAGLLPTFKLTAASEPAGLDRALAERGYRLADPTLVQCVDLASARFEVTHDDPGCAETRLFDAPAATWLEDCAALSSLTPARRAGLAETSLRIHAAPEPCVFALVVEAGRAVCAGLGAVRGDFVHLAEIVTAPDARRRGHARTLIRSVCGWGRRAGARQGLLQVVADNGPAIGLYASLGFEEVYRYWYRMHPDEDAGR